jgi:hypothetical protein
MEGAGMSAKTILEQYLARAFAVCAGGFHPEKKLNAGDRLFGP